MDVLRSIALFVVAAVAEIGGAWLVWQGVAGALVCLVGVAVIMYAPRSA
jgi:drug/metabolite transporter superfamily protein YnfA